MTGDGNEGGDSPGVPESLVLAAFDDPEPLTAPEVVAATGMDREDVESALDALVAAGRLGEKSVREDLTLWYPTPGGGNGAGSAAGRHRARIEREGETADEGDGEATGTDDGGSDPAKPDWSSDEVTVQGGGLTGGEEGNDFDESQIEAAVADLEVPGTSEMMRDWRRSAVRAAFDFLREQGQATRNELVRGVYSSHRAGYDDPEAWWDCVGPRLETLPGVERDGDRWEFVGTD